MEKGVATLRERWFVKLTYQTCMLRCYGLDLTIIYIMYFKILITMYSSTHTHTEREREMVRWIQS